MQKVLHLKDDVYRLYVWRKEEDLPALKTALTQQHNDLRITYKSAVKLKES